MWIGSNQTHHPLRKAFMLSETLIYGEKNNQKCHRPTETVVYDTVASYYTVWCNSLQLLLSCSVGNM